MKAIGIQIEGDEAIIVVLEKCENDDIIQTPECIKLKINDHLDSAQIKQFRDQINSMFDLVDSTLIGVKARNAKAKAGGQVRPPSPLSFKLEGIIQLYDKRDIDFVWPQTISAFKKKQGEIPSADKKYQQDAYEIAYYLLTK